MQEGRAVVWYHKYAWSAPALPSGKLEKRPLGSCKEIVLTEKVYVYAFVLPVDYRIMGLWNVGMGVNSGWRLLPWRGTLWVGWNSGSGQRDQARRGCEWEKFEQKKGSTLIAEIFVRVKISYSSVRELLYAVNFRTARAVSHTLLYLHGFRMLLHFVLSAESTKRTKLNCVRKFLRFQYKKRRSFVFEFIKRLAHRPSKNLSFSDLPSSLVRLAIERPTHHFSAMQRVLTQTSPGAVSGLKQFDPESLVEILEILTRRQHAKSLKTNWLLLQIVARSSGR